MDHEEGLREANLLKCKLTRFPICYLDLLISNKILFSSDWDPITRKVEKRVDLWQVKIMSSRARLTLTNVCLSAIPSYEKGLFIPLG